MLVPGGVDLESLFEVIRTVLVADRQLKEKALFSLANDQACSEIRFTVEDTRRELIQLLKRWLPNHPKDGASGVLKKASAQLLQRRYGVRGVPVSVDTLTA